MFRSMLGHACDWMETDGRGGRDKYEAVELKRVCTRLHWQVVLDGLSSRDGLERPVLAAREYWLA